MLAIAMPLLLLCSEMYRRESCSENTSMSKQQSRWSGCLIHSLTTYEWTAAAWHA